MPIKTWIGTTTNWSTASNWSPAVIPQPTDDVVFNNSANCIINISSTVNSVDFTGYTGAFSTSSIANIVTIAGSSDGTATGVSLRFSTGMTVTSTPQFTFTSSIGGYIYCNGKSLTNTITFNNATGVWSNQDTLSSSAAITLTTGTLNINANLTTGAASTFTFTAGTINTNNGANITCGVFSSNNSNTRTLNMGWGIWALTSTGVVWNLATSTGMTLNAQQSRILINNTASPTAINTFAGGGLTYYTVEYARGASTGNFNITGSNTYANFIDNTSTVAHTYSWQSLTTQTFYKFNIRGSAGARITFASSAGTAATLVKAGQGIVCYCDYLTVSGNTSCSPTSGVWYAGANSTGSGGNWTVTNAPSSRSLLGAGGVG